MSACVDPEGHADANDDPADELTASYFTLTGSRVGEPARHPLDDRLRAAAAAGFSGVALAAAELRDIKRTGGHAGDIAAAVRAHALQVPELEPLRGWDTAEEPTEDERDIFELADALGSVRVNTIQVAQDIPRADVIRRLAGVCRRAAEHGLTVAFEPRAHSPVRTPASAAALAADTGSPNLRLVLDAYHFHRVDLGSAALDAVPAELVCSLHLNDMLAVPHGDAVEDALEYRLAPGDGVIDLPAWLRRLRAHGVNASISVEVLSREFNERPLPEAACKAFAAAGRVLALARVPHASA